MANLYILPLLLLLHLRSIRTATDLDKKEKRSYFGTLFYAIIQLLYQLDLFISRTNATRCPILSKAPAVQSAGRWPEPERSKAAPGRLQRRLLKTGASFWQGWSCSVQRCPSWRTSEAVPRSGPQRTAPQRRSATEWTSAPAAEDYPAGSFPPRQTSPQRPDTGTAAAGSRSVRTGSFWTSLCSLWSAWWCCPLGTTSVFCHYPSR